MSKDREQDGGILSTWWQAAFHPGALFAGMPRVHPLALAVVVSVRSDRIGAPVNGKPTLPSEHRDIQPALDACLRARPPVSQTTPPTRS